MINLLSLFQLGDSNFPTGSFSHSFGLETYIQEGQVVDKRTFLAWLQSFFDGQLIHTEGLACRLAYEALEEGWLDQIWDLDRLLTVQSQAKESREGTRRIGERMLKLGLVLYPDSLLTLYHDRVMQNLSFGHPALVLIILAHHLQIEKKLAVAFHLYTVVNNLVQNGIRAIPLGQTDGQQILKTMQTRILEAVQEIEQLSLDDFGVYSLGLEIAQMQHEHLHIRLFMS